MKFQLRQFPLIDSTASLRGQRWFILSAGAILAVTGLAKVVSAMGDVSVLTTNDPVFGIQFRHLLAGVGLVELVAATLCFFTRWTDFCTSMIAVLASSFLVYRAGLWLTNWQAPCPCLGVLTQNLGISPQFADRIALSLLIYLLAGVYLLIFFRFKVNNPN